MRLADLAARIGASVDGDGDLEIRGLAPIEAAGPGELTFVANPRYRNRLAATKAAAVIVARDEETHGRAALRADDPYAAFVEALAIFDSRPCPEPGIHPMAVVADSAEVGAGAYIGPYVVIGENVVLGDGAALHPHVVIYPGAVVGDRFTAHAGAVVRESVVIGDDVTLQPGVVIGGDGFGFLPRPGARALAIPQIGTVEIGDDVDVGANTTIDRAAVGATRLDHGVKLDNLVMVAHGCAIGEGSMVAAQTGMAGSSVLGRKVMVGGQAGFGGHLEVGDAVHVAGQAGVSKDVSAGRVVAGTPAVDIALWRRGVAALRRLPELLQRVRRLEERLDGDGGGKP